MISSDFYIDSKDVQFLIDTLHFRFTPTSLKKNSVNNEIIEYKNFIKDLNTTFSKSFDSLQTTVKDNKRTPQQIDYIVKLRDKYSIDYIRLLKKFVELHPNSYYFFWELVNIHHGSGYKSELENIFNLLDASTRNSDIGKLFLSDLMKSKILAIGQPFKNIILKNHTLENVDFDLSTVKKEFLLIDYWHSQCSP